MTTTREEWWMSTPDDEKKIVSALWAAEAMARDRESVMALTKDLKVRPLKFTNHLNLLETVRYERS